MLKGNLLDLRSEILLKFNDTRSLLLFYCIIEIYMFSFELSKL